MCADSNGLLSLEDREELFRIIAWIFGSSLLFYLEYIVYLLHYGLLKTSWDILTIVMAPIMTVPFIAGLIVSELFTRRRISKPLRFHLERFATYCVFLFVNDVLMFFFLYFVDIYLEPFVGYRSMIVGLVSYSVIFAVIMLKYADKLPKY